MQKYHPGTLIRHIRTGQPLFVIHVYKTAAIVVDPTEGNLPISRVLLERDYPDWTEEVNIESHELTHDPNNPMVEFQYHPIAL